MRQRCLPGRPRAGSYRRQPDQKKLDITLLGELYEGRGDSLSVETAPGADGITGRMAVQATTPGTDPNWVVFALTNPTDSRIERILSSRRYELAPAAR